MIVCLAVTLKFGTESYTQFILYPIKKRLNNAESIDIGDHVWIGSDVIVLKGSKISGGSVVGLRSLVKGKVEKNVLVVGSPARQIRKNIEWKRS